MRFRSDFVTNSSSSSFILAVVCPDIHSDEELAEHIAKREDLGPTWYQRLDAYICSCTVGELKDINFGWYNYNVEQLNYFTDERQNFMPDTTVFYAEITDHGDYDPTIEEIILKRTLPNIGVVVLETEPFECG